MQILATSKGTDIKLTKQERKLLADCEAFVELLGNHVPALAENAVKVVRGLGDIQFAIDPPPKEELPY